MPKELLICCHQTCPKQGSMAVLRAFQQQAPKNIKIIASSCLGECGSGPMVLVLPEKIWYAHVQVTDVSEIVVQHLISDRPVKRKLYSKFHPTSNGAVWLISCCVVVGLLGLLLWFLASQTSYI